MLTLLSLPPEIRLQIYAHIFNRLTVRPSSCSFLRDDGIQEGITLYPPSKYLNVLLTCRTIHNEAIPSFYSLAQFKFERDVIPDTKLAGWSLTDIASHFPTRKSLDDPTISPFSRTLEPGNSPSICDLVRFVHYAGDDAHFVRSIGLLFPNLQRFEFDLQWTHVGFDQTNFDQAMKYALRNREWRYAIKDALEQRFSGDMTMAVWHLQKMATRQNRMSSEAAPSVNGKDATRNFKVTLLWKLAHCSVEFEGECDLDEWVLRVWDPKGQSKNVYDIRQDPLFFEIG